MSLKNDPIIARKIGWITATSIVVANMIGAGIFTTSGLMAGNLPNPNWVLLFWFIGGMIAISGAMCYAELATRMPEDGGEYLYLKRLYHPSLGFLSGWTSFFVGFSAPIAASALGFAEYIIPDAGLSVSGEIIQDPVWIKKGLALSVIALFTFVHYLGHKWGSRIQNLLTVVKILIVFGLASLGMILGKGNWSNLQFQSGDAYGGLAIGTAMMLVMFSYSGWNASSYIAGEMKNPRKSLPLSLLLGTGIVIAVYLSVNLFIFRSLPFREIQGTIAIFEKASIAALGDWFGRILGILTAIALLASLSAFVMIGPRIYYAMALDKLFFPFAARIHRRFGVPGRSILVQGSIALILVLIGSFEQIIIYVEFALLIFPFFSVAGLFIARKKKIGESMAVRVTGYPFVPLFFLLCNLLIMIIAYINRPLESTAAVITVLIGIPIYFVWAKGMKIS
jgi:APA family basic amino acid/polyamine antiporter